MRFGTHKPELHDFTQTLWQRHEGNTLLASPDSKHLLVKQQQTYGTLIWTPCNEAPFPEMFLESVLNCQSNYQLKHGGKNQH